MLSIKGATVRVEDQIPLLVELQDVDNRVKIKLANPEVHAVVTHDVIGQIMVACCMQPGLASVLEAVMSFEGSELYVQAWPELVGRRFGDILCVFDDATVLGVVADGAGRTGGGAGYTRDIGGAVNPGLRLNPDDEYVLEAGDALIVLADDDDSYAVNPRALAQLDTGVAQGRGGAGEGAEASEAAEGPRRKGAGEDGVGGMPRKGGGGGAVGQRPATAEMVGRGGGQGGAGGEAGTRAQVKRAAVDVLTRVNESVQAGAGTLTLSRKNKSTQRSPAAGGRGSERIVFLGWRRDMADMIKTLDVLVSPGSELWLVNNVPVPERVQRLRDDGNKAELNLANLRIKNALGNPIIRRDLVTLNALDEFGDPTGESLALVDFDSTLVLADQVPAVGEQRVGDVMSTDGRSLATFLLVCDVRRKLFLARTAGEDGVVADEAEAAFVDSGRDRIISEILDAVNTQSLLSQVCICA